MADLSEYGPLLNLDNIKRLFKGERGSLYAQHENGSTTGYREPSNMAGTGKKLQNPSAKTLFMEPRAAYGLNSWINDEYLGTELKPTLDANNKLTAVEVHATEDVPRRNITKGQVLSKIPATMVPDVGLLPVEIGGRGFVSPIGEKTGNKVHWGNKIVEVHEPKLKGKLGIAAALASGAGAASAGELRKAAGDVAESALPWWMTGGNAGPADENEQVDLRQRMAEAGAKAGAGRGNPVYDPRKLDQTIEMPAEYKAGGRVRII
jgi:hypothetical protein